MNNQFVRTDCGSYINLQYVVKFVDTHKGRKLDRQFECWPDDCHDYPRWAAIIVNDDSAYMPHDWHPADLAYKEV